MEKTTSATPAPNFKKATAEIIKLQAGEAVEGIFTGSMDGPWMDKKTGEEKTLTRLYFTKTDGEKFILFEDGGLRNAMANAGVKENMLIRIEKGEKAALGGGRSVNQYDIYIAE